MLIASVLLILSMVCTGLGHLLKSIPAACSDRIVEEPET